MSQPESAKFSAIPRNRAPSHLDKFSEDKKRGRECNSPLTAGARRHSACPSVQTRSFLQLSLKPIEGLDSFTSETLTQINILRGLCASGRILLALVRQRRPRSTRDVLLRHRFRLSSYSQFWANPSKIMQQGS